MWSTCALRSWAAAQPERRRQRGGDWLEGEFRVLGLQPLGGAWLHGFNTSDGLARNVMGLIPGSSTPPAMWF